MVCLESIGLLLGLLGGTPNVTTAADAGVHLRSDIHILIVGDPGKNTIE